MKLVVTLALMTSIVTKCSPLSPSLRFGNKQKSYGAISGEYKG